MSAPGKARRRLAYVDPANHTPQFSWKKVGKSLREVFCEKVPLSEIARRFGTPAFVYSRHAITDAFCEIDRGLHRIPHLLCFAVKANGNLSLLRLLAGLGSGFDIVSGGELDHLGHLASLESASFFRESERRARKFARRFAIVATGTMNPEFCNSTSNRQPNWKY
jgi:hypothetical protein